MWWMSAKLSFGKGWIAKKFWYSTNVCAQPSKDVTESSINNDIGYPDGVTVGPMFQETRLVAALNRNCHKCGIEVMFRTPSMTIVNTGENGKKVIKHYHFPSCCPLDKCNEICVAIDKSTYPEEGKKILHTQFEAYKGGA